MLRIINEKRNEHILRFFGAFTKGDDEKNRNYYLLFEWADGGSLEDAWKENPRPETSKELVQQAAWQLLGLAEALKITHAATKIRHGDIKPQNILRFGNTTDSIFGTLKIGDWGLAKYHANTTVWRAEKGVKTTTRYSTRLYEAPEVELGKLEVLGRQFDIWSMGCLMLELLIWFLYGFDCVERFRDDVRGRSQDGLPCYEATDPDDGTLVRARLRKIVVMWMDYIEAEKACDSSSAMGELLRIIRNDLLVVELPKERSETKYIREWVPPQTKSESRTPPRINIEEAPTSSKDELDPKITGTQRTRATSERLVALLHYEGEGLLDDSDRHDQYWFWQPPGHQRKGPPEFKSSSQQDHQRNLTVPGGLSAGMGRLDIENRALVSKPTTPYSRRSANFVTR